MRSSPNAAEQARIAKLRLRANGVHKVAGAENRRAAGSGVKRATDSTDGETITVHIPLTFRKRGGRKLVVTPDGAAWAPRPWVDNAMVKALARAFRSSGCWTRACGMIEELARRDLAPGSP